MEIVNGAGTLLYGSDALAGTINIITNEPAFSSDTRWLYGFNGFYSSNENGARGTATIGATAPRYAVRLQAGMESFDNYKAGTLDVEDTQPVLRVRRARPRPTPSTTTSASPSTRFPIRSTRPTSAPSNEVPNSGANGHFVNLSGLVKLGEQPHRCASATSAGR